MKKVAIFDIDGTIFRSSLLIELTDALVQQGIFPAKVSRIYVKACQNWLDKKGPYEDYIGAVIKAFDSNIKGVKYEKFSRVARKVAAFHKNRNYRYSRDLLRNLKKKNYYLLAISHSPQKIVKEFAKKLGFVKVYGRIFELDKQRKFTGKMLYSELIFSKAKILKRAVEKEKLTLKGSVGVGDTEGDIPFLKMVDNPICFNPNLKLYRYAKRLGWKIVIERKDVICCL